MVGLLISLASGAIGGNLVGMIAKNLNLGVLGNSIAGIVGGGAGSQILSMLGAGGAEGADVALSGIIGQIAGGGVGGGVLMAIVGVVKGAMSKG